MTDEEWVIVPNWERFQHYSDRDPVWIKLYTELNSNPEWLELGAAARGMLTTIWVEYARSRGQLKAETVMHLCGKSARTVHLESLNDAGFIQLSASRPLALTRSREKILREEEEKSAGASERAVDNSPRPRKENKTSDYTRAENMTRNAGWQYEPIDFLAELEKFNLDPGQRHDLEHLRFSLANGAANNEDEW